MIKLKCAFIKVIPVVLLCFLVALLTTGCQIGNNGLLLENNTTIPPTPEEYFTFDEETRTITDYDTAGGLDVIIPATINGIPVDYIGDFAFHYNNLTTVTIPDSITAIGRFAFYHNYLESVTIPGSVIIIGEDAFAANSNLTSVIISDGVIVIDEEAFHYNNLTSLNIPDSVIKIGAFAFTGNDITSITIGANVFIDSSYFNNNTMSSNKFFTQFYNNGGKKAGTYVYNNTGFPYSAEWTKI
jgi:hypothetical protein